MQIFQILTTQIAQVKSLGNTSVVHLGWLSNIIKSIIEGVGIVGVGIILFSLILKAIVLPFDIYQRVAMSKQNAKMKENQDKMEKLQKQYANDKTAYNQKLMEMYKENGISMFSSCLPAILSIVIFIVAINAFTSYSKYADLNNYNALVDAYHTSLIENSAEITDGNIKTGTIDGTSYTITPDGSGNYFLVVDEADESKYMVMSVIKKDFATAEEKVAYVKESQRNYYVDVERYRNYVGNNALTASECSAQVKETALNRVKTEYEQTISGNMKFLWIKNIWQTDASFKHPVLSYSDFSKTLSELDANVKSVSPYDEGSYNFITEKLGDYKTQANGYYVLIVLSIGTILLQQLISMKTQKEQQKYSSADGSGASNQKMMMVIMTVMFAIFSFMYSAAFSIYMVTSNIISMLTTLIINKIVDVSMRKAEEKKLQQKYDNRFPGRTYGKEKRKKSK
ncbi:MAG: YidC/Oxa1 family membrane protein insertase [Candidatus Borkfalkiaceae bacterium]|nr:YidC/Oxa1 family membrane protein insertase [Clostridia bacterium]MDY6222651.1 YidC/Oxa1 family membrane protein insertase [Christensenellaceae bacterium]